MKSFFADLKRYFPYAKHTAISELKSQVAESYLGWVWWILDPLLYMAVYTFIVEVVFGTTKENFPLFVFIGLVAWKYFSSSVTSAANIIRSYRSVILKVSIPKYIFIIIQMIINLVKMLIGLGIAISVIIFLDINITFNILEIIPLIFIYSVFTFGVSLIFAHFGVYIYDLRNITSVLLRLLFYLSGVFYSVDRFPVEIQNIYDFICPTGLILYQFREVILYGKPALNFFSIYWLIIGLVFSLVGVILMKRHDKDYIKVI